MLKKTHNIFHRDQGKTVYQDISLYKYKEGNSEYKKNQIFVTCQNPDCSLHTNTWMCAKINILSNTVQLLLYIFILTLDIGNIYPAIIIKNYQICK